MNRDQLLQALMFYKPEAKWSFDQSVEPENITYDNIIWEDAYYTKPTEDQLQQFYDQSVKTYSANTDYRKIRQRNYPSVEEQLDTIFHEGVDSWKQKIQLVKDKYSKP